MQKRQRRIAWMGIVGLALGAATPARAMPEVPEDLPDVLKALITGKPTRRASRWGAPAEE